MAVHSVDTMHVCRAAEVNDAPADSDPEAWFLTAAERGNPSTLIDGRRDDGRAWTSGNEVRVHVDGAAYYARLHQALLGVEPGDHVWFADWEGDADERLDGPGTEIGRTLRHLAERGAVVRGLLWRSHPRQAHFDEQDHMHLARDLNQGGATLALDERVRRGGSHHQKVVVIGGPAPERAAGDRVATYDLVNHAGTPIYVHAKVVIVDDVWPEVGSDNFNRRSWTHDSELGCAVLDERRDARAPADPAGLGDGARRLARDTRLALWCEHLGRQPGDDADLVDPGRGFDVLRRSARALTSWEDGGCRGERPTGHLALHRSHSGPRWIRPIADVAYRLTLDPDGRLFRQRRADSY